MTRRLMSDYEVKEASRFISDIYELHGRSLDEEEWTGEAWVAYMELWRRCEGRIYLYYDWGQVYHELRAVMARLKSARNKKITLESRLSLNAVYGENGQMAEAWFPRVRGDFVNQIALWDYVKRLGGLKARILTLMAKREEDYEIMEAMHLSVQEYYLIKMELRFDFEMYLKLG